MSILAVPLLGNEDNNTVGSWHLPSLGARFSPFSHAVSYPQAFSVCCFSARNLFGLHLSLKEKETQSPFNSCYYYKLLFSHCSLFQPNSKKLVFSFSSSLYALYLCTDDLPKLWLFQGNHPLLGLYWHLVDESLSLLLRLSSLWQHRQCRQCIFVGLFHSFLCAPKVEVSWRPGFKSWLSCLLVRKLELCPSVSLFIK